MRARCARHPEARVRYLSLPLISQFISLSRELGALTIRELEGRIVADVGEWSSRLWMVEVSGERVWVFGDPPLSGFPVRPAGDELILPAPQHDYVFRRAQ